MRAAAAELFDLAARGVLTIEISRTYALHDAAQAHRDIENRNSVGSMLLLP
jgi:NADPH2:quinone reductase